MRQDQIRCTWLTAVLALSSLQTMSAGMIFQDGFEGGTLDPFWTFGTPINNGTMQFDNTVAHGGSQSIRLNSQQFGGNALLSHQFNTATLGTVEVWMYDPLIVGTGYKQLWVGQGTPLTGLDNYAIYYDWGKLTTELYYPVTDLSGTTSWGHVVLASSSQSAGWHKWLFSSTATEVQVQIDGVVVFSRTGSYPFNWVGLNNCCIVGQANFDDFAFSSPDPVPEPSSGWVAGVLCAGLLMLRRCPALRYLVSRT